MINQLGGYTVTSKVEKETKMKWNKIADGLPPEGEVILFLLNYKYPGTGFNIKGQLYHNNFAFPGKALRHWEGPKGELWDQVTHWALIDSSEPQKEEPVFLIQKDGIK